ncbi:RNA-directed DNA polymerase, eukaryota, reverse transcriptase zinc-binding domain protein [Tanacetum coccineum]
MGMRREMINQGMKDVSDENVNEISNGSNVTIDKHKSNHEDGINTVLELSPWLVNAKPLVVQKWDPDVNIVKSEPKSIPMWIKLYNVPLEAWSKKEISAISSRVGKPLIMDQVTANMRYSGVGRIGFARVLVEIDAAKGYTNKIEIIYMDAEKNVKRRKSIDVEYAWKPLEGNGNKRSSDNNIKMVYKPKEKSNIVDVDYLYKKHGENCSNNLAENSTNGSKKEISPNQSMWRFDKGILENLKRSANKFFVL